MRTPTEIRLAATRWHWNLVTQHGGVCPQGGDTQVALLHASYGPSLEFNGRDRWVKELPTVCDDLLQEGFFSLKEFRFRGKQCCCFLLFFPVLSTYLVTELFPPPTVHSSIRDSGVTSSVPVSPRSADGHWDGHISWVMDGMFTMLHPLTHPIMGNPIQLQHRGYLGC